MESRGAFVGDVYANRSYDNHVLNSHTRHALPNNYIAYQQQEAATTTYSPVGHSVGHTVSHPPNSNPHSHYNNNSPQNQSRTHLHSVSQYNSSQSYGSSVNHYSDMYTCGTSRNVYAANIPSRAAINSSNVKYWSAEQQMSQNSHNYNHDQGIPQGIPPPPLVSRTQAISSPTLRSPQCNSNNYATVSGHHSSPSPQGWSPNVMHSPSTTPSPLPAPLPPSNTRSPSHVSQQSQQFSPSHTGMSDSSHHSMQKSQVSVGYTNQNSTSSQANCSNPLQSLQKMVMIDAENSDIRNSYESISASSVQNNGTVQSMTPNMIQRTYNTDQSVNNDPESPYPTYYNLDQNRLCTPPRPSPNPSSVANPSFANIPNAQTDAFQNDGLVFESVNELKKDDSNTATNNSETLENKTIDLISSFECNSDIVESKGKQASEALQNADERDNVVNGENKNDDSSTIDSSASKKDVLIANQTDINQEQRIPSLCKRTTSRDSLQSSDSETTHSYSDSRATHWSSVAQMDKPEYFNNQVKSNKNVWWPSNNLPQSTQALPVQQTPNLSAISAGIPSYASMSECGPHPNSSPMTYHSSVLPSSSWTPSSSSAPSITLPSNKHFASPKSPKDKKKRGRPFGSKNRRRDSEDTGSETTTSDTRSPFKKRKKAALTEERGMNTTVSIDAHGVDELAAVNQIKNVSSSLKRKKLRINGPFIRIEKGKQKKTEYSIVNASHKTEDEKDVKGKSHSSGIEPNRPIRRSSIIGVSKKVVSTLSPLYDLNTRDKSWVCSLCQKGPHFKGLGDLFGPYYVQMDEKDKPSNQSQTDSIDETINAVIASESNEKKLRNSAEKRKKSDNSDEGANKKQKQSLRSPNATNPANISNSDSTHSHSQSLQKEVWVHEDCIVWSSGVYLVGHRVRNLEEIFSDSNESICTKCKLSGATLGCLQKSCNTSQFHYLCAKEKGCDMDEENFSLYCPKHKKKAKDLSKCNSDEPSIS